MDQGPTNTPIPPSTPVVISADNTGDDFAWGRTQQHADCLYCGEHCTGDLRDSHDRNLAGSEQRWRELAAISEQLTLQRLLAGGAA